MKLINVFTFRINENFQRFNKMYESATFIVGPRSNSVTGRVKSRACLIRTKAKIKSKEVNNLQYDNAFGDVS